MWAPTRAREIFNNGNSIFGTVSGPIISCYRSWDFRDLLSLGQQRLGALFGVSFPPLSVSRGRFRGCQ